MPKESHCSEDAASSSSGTVAASVEGRERRAGYSGEYYVGRGVASNAAPGEESSEDASGVVVREAESGAGHVVGGSDTASFHSVSAECSMEAAVEGPLYVSY